MKVSMTEVATTTRVTRGVEGWVSCGMGGWLLSQSGAERAIARKKRGEKGGLSVLSLPVHAGEVS
jgi:hypothetical protein